MQLGRSGSCPMPPHTSLMSCCAVLIRRGASLLLLPLMPGLRLALGPGCAWAGGLPYRCTL
jgi:hypothetical protein